MEEESGLTLELNIPLSQGQTCYIAQATDMPDRLRELMILICNEGFAVSNQLYLPFYSVETNVLDSSCKNVVVGAISAKSVEKYHRGLLDTAKDVDWLVKCTHEVDAVVMDNQEAKEYVFARIHDKIFHVIIKSGIRSILKQLRYGE